MLSPLTNVLFAQTKEAYLQPVAKKVGKGFMEVILIYRGDGEERIRLEWPLTVTESPEAEALTALSAGPGDGGFDL
jgi:hypothetical protein